MRAEITKSGRLVVVGDTPAEDLALERWAEHWSATAKHELMRAELAAYMDGLAGEDGNDYADPGPSPTPPTGWPELGVIQLGNIRELKGGNYADR